jgi:hypothetical protein
MVYFVGVVAGEGGKGARSLLLDLLTTPLQAHTTRSPGLSYVLTA